MPRMQRGMGDCTPLKIAHVSDTHNEKPDLPDADLLVHSGDLTIRGYRVEFYRQTGWLHENLHRYKQGILLSPGNHDLYAEAHLEKVVEDCKAAGITLLHNSGVTIEGLKFWGSAHTPFYHDWAFMLKDEDAKDPKRIREAWAKIPNDTDVLITHGPAAGILDLSYRGHIGCPELLKRIMEINPNYYGNLKAHLFGHAHEGYGQTKIGDIQFVNSAAGKPQVIEVIEI